VKGQTASGSYKPAKTVERRPRHGAPAHRQTGTRVVILTEDGAYVERAKD
jgi:elongation factor P